jgi:hypothetical protein
MGDKLGQFINSPVAQVALPVAAGIAAAATPGIGRGVGTALEAIRLKDVMRQTAQDRGMREWEFGQAQKQANYRDMAADMISKGASPEQVRSTLAQINPEAGLKEELSYRDMQARPTEEEAYASAPQMPVGATKKVQTRTGSDIQLTGPEIPKPAKRDTSLTEFGGNRALIDAQTGETIKTLGPTDTGGAGGKAQSEAYTQLSNAMNVARGWLALPEVPSDIAASGDIAKLVVWQYSQPKTKETIFAWLPTALKSSNLEERRAALRMQAAYKKYMNMFPEDVAGQEQPQQPQVQMKPEVQRAIEAARRARSGS